MSGKILNHKYNTSGRGCTVRLDITMYDTLQMHIGQALKHLHGIQLYNAFIFNATVLQQSCKTATLTIFFEYVDFTPVYFNAIILHNIWVVEYFHDAEFISYLGIQVGQSCKFLKLDFLDSQIDRAKSPCANESPLPPSDGDIQAGRSKEKKGLVFQLLIVQYTTS